MRPDEGIDAIARVIRQSAVSLGSVLAREPNYAREDNRLHSPWVTLQPVSIPRSSPHDTDRVEFVTDGQGRKVGQIFQTTWEMDVQIDVWQPTPASRDVSEVGYNVQKALLEHDVKREAEPFPDGAGGIEDEIDNFRVGEAERRDDLTAEHSLRRWYQEARLVLSDRVDTTTDTIEAVDTPRDGEAVGEVGGGVTLEFND
jgi:hypothetical protein